MNPEDNLHFGWSCAESFSDLRHCLESMTIINGIIGSGRNCFRGCLWQLICINFI